MAFSALVYVFHAIWDTSCLFYREFFFHCGTSLCLIHFILTAVIQGGSFLAGDMFCYRRVRDNNGFRGGPDQSAGVVAVPCFGLKKRRRRALLTTKTELKLMARAAIIGFIFRPKAA